MADQKRYEMLWDCPGCGTEKLLGITHRHCPNCGNVQDPKRRYFPPEGSEIAVENHPWQGADRVCPGCDTPNAAKAGFCVNCGSPMDGAKEAARRDDKRAGEADSASAATQEAEAKRQAERKRQQEAQDRASGAAPPPEKKGGMSLLLLAAAGIALLACLGIGVALLWKQDAAIVVTGHSWERTIAVETLKNVEKTGWQDEIPAGAALGACREEQRSTKKVEDGQECETKKKDKGDGSFEKVEECHPKYKEEPVYGQKCNYSITEWTVTDTAKAAGKGTNPAPAWPTPAIANPGDCVGCQREGKRSESYTLHVLDDKQQSRTCTVGGRQWSVIPLNSRWKAQSGVLTSALDCSSLKPM